MNPHSRVACIPHCDMIASCRGTWNCAICNQRPAIACELPHILQKFTTVKATMNPKSLSIRIPNCHMIFAPGRCPTAVKNQIPGIAPYVKCPKVHEKWLSTAAMDPKTLTAAVPGSCMHWPWRWANVVSDQPPGSKRCCQDVQQNKLLESEASAHMTMNSEGPTSSWPTQEMNSLIFERWNGLHIYGRSAKHTVHKP